MPPFQRSGVFISYARTDGEPQARELRQRLEAEGIRLWQDREGMEGGRDWWLQITAALDSVEFMVLVMTPAAMDSAVVRKEWRYARQHGVCVYPVMGGADLDFSVLPRWMRSLHFYDLEHEWAKFLNDLRTRCEQRRVPFMADDLPLGLRPASRGVRAGSCRSFSIASTTSRSPLRPRCAQQAAMERRCSRARCATTRTSRTHSTTGSSG